MPQHKRRLILISSILVMLALIGVSKFFGVRITPDGIVVDPAGSVFPYRLTRKYGMAPAAHDGFVRACTAAKVHPWRLSQTIGDAPRSVGYHHRDGVLIHKGKKIDYTAAVDIVTSDLTRPQIMRLVEELGRQGFAAFYREGPRWVNGEHIHAIYAPLTMKPQLRKQVREWERKRRRAGKPAFKWQKRWRRNWRA